MSLDFTDFFIFSTFESLCLLFLLFTFRKHLTRPTAGLSRLTAPNFFSEARDSEFELESESEPSLSESDELNLGLGTFLITLLMLLSFVSATLAGLGSSPDGVLSCESSFGEGLLHDLRTVAIVRRSPPVWELVTLNWGGMLLDEDAWLELELSVSVDE